MIPPIFLHYLFVQKTPVHGLKWLRTVVTVCSTTEENKNVTVHFWNTSQETKNISTGDLITVYAVLTTTYRNYLKKILEQY